MAIRTVVKMGHPVLRRPADKVEDFNNPQLHNLIQDLWDTLDKQGGVGLAAPQIAVPLKVVVVRITAEQVGTSGRPTLEPMVLINPVISPISDNKVENWEACLSIPDLQGLVPRYTQIALDYQDIQGIRRHLEARDFIAKLFQHECDHLEGILYPQRMTNIRSLVYRSEFDPEG